MYKSIKYIIIFLFIIIIFIIINYLIYCGIKIRNNIDNFSNKYYSDFDIDTNLDEGEVNKDYDCNNFFKDNSFCSNDDTTSNCSCNFQKDDLRYLFNSPDTCCNKLCRKYSPEKCLSTTPFLKEKYYCRDGNKCVEHKGIILNSRISANTCGKDPLNNQLLLPYADYNECKKSINVCDKYNIVERSPHINKQECIKDINCGYCSNNTGEGLCIVGTVSGPQDLEKYFYCNPGSVSKKYSYTYGNHMDFILQS